MTKSVVRQQGAFDQAVNTQPQQFEFACHLPDVPVQPETLLLIDLEIQETAVDLRRLSRLILNDLGATVQLLRLAAHEYRNADICPTRIEDYITDLGLDSCMEAMSAQTIVHDSRHRAIAQTWAHSREIAHHSMLIADETQEVNPDEAYLVGLFHAIGSLPAVLGWDGCCTSITDCSLIGLKLARKWSLPRFVMEYFHETQMAGSHTLWLEIVEKAHWHADRPTMPRTHRNDLRPQLLHVV